MSGDGLCPVELLRRAWWWARPLRSVHRLESTVRYLGIEVDDALDIAEQLEV
jgi:hypothetical protein